LFSLIYIPTSNLAKVEEGKVSLRLKATKTAGIDMPRLEQLASKLELDDFEVAIIVLLIGRTLSPVIKTLLGAVDTSNVQKLDELCTVNQILTIFTQSFGEQVSRRIYFYKSAKLLKRSVVKINRGRWHSGSSDLMDQRIEIDRRILDWVVGLDTEINELVEGSDLYLPKVTLDNVVLQDGQKEELLEAVDAYDGLKKYREGNADLKQMFSYGNGLVVLLCGPSGTGKTMTVNAVANHLQKRVLLVDFPSLHGKRQSESELDADLRGLFREADVSNAVLFFDEVAVFLTGVALALVIYLTKIALTVLMFLTELALYCTDVFYWFVLMFLTELALY
jgi:hypothetical protein